MNFSAFIKKKNKLLLPFSWLYQLGAYGFHKLYDLQLLKTTAFPLPVICIGNLAVGGTGKSPMAEYIIKLLKEKYTLAIISRGYKRKAKGFIIANKNTTAADIGDEPMQFHTKFPGITVAVGANRVAAVQQLLATKPETAVIILDDAFQHRAITAGLSIVLTAYNNVFTDDYYLPAGELRDLKSNYKRAAIIVVTKCPAEISNDEKRSISAEINPLPTQEIYFTTPDYDLPYHLVDKHTIGLPGIKKVILFTAIADPQTLIDYFNKHTIEVKPFLYQDHHTFTATDMRTIIAAYEQNKEESTILLTTEKDAVKLTAFQSQIQQLPVFVIPVAHRFLFDEKEKFDHHILKYTQEHLKK